MSEKSAEELQGQEQDPGPDENLDDESQGEGGSSGEPDEVEPEGKESESGEIEIVREGKGSQPRGKKTRTFTDRINRLNRQKADERARADLADANAELLAEQLKVTKAELEQVKNHKTALAKPNPDDFEEGAYDPKFIEAQEKYTETLINNTVKQEVSRISQSTGQDHQIQNLKEKAHKHYKRAEELGAKDFAEVEDKAIENLGEKLVNDIIETFPDSEKIIYYYGVNSEDAKALKELVLENPVLGVSEIGALRKDLKVRPKSKTAPSPDEELEGSKSSPAGKRGPKGATFS